MPLSARKAGGAGSTSAAAAGDGPAALMQLPHVSEQVARALGRRKVKGLAELLVRLPEGSADFCNYALGSELLQIFEEGRETPERVG